MFECISASISVESLFFRKAVVRQTEHPAFRFSATAQGEHKEIPFSSQPRLSSLTNPLPMGCEPIIASAHHLVTADTVYKKSESSKTQAPFLTCRFGRLGTEARASEARMARASGCSTARPGEAEGKKPSGRCDRCGGRVQVVCVDFVSEWRNDL